MILARNRYLQQLIDSQCNGLVKTIMGIRRCGKSVLLMHLFYKWLIGQKSLKDLFNKTNINDAKEQSYPLISRLLG